MGLALLGYAVFVVALYVHLPTVPPDAELPRARYRDGSTGRTINVVG